MTSDIRTTSRERAIAKRYVVTLGILVLAYIAVLFASIHVLRTQHISGAEKALIAVTPAIPMAGVIAAVVQFVASVDELQRRIHLEALAIAAGVTAALALTYTFLEGAGLPHSQAWWAFVCLDVVWALALPFVRRRYA